MTADRALAAVSELLDHEYLDTTINYLKIAENEPTGDEIYEDVLGYMEVFDDWNELEELGNELILVGCTDA